MGSCLTLRNALSEEINVLTRQKTLPGRSAWVESKEQGEGTQENCSALWLAISDFMGMGLVSGLSLINLLAQPGLGLTQGPFW